MPGGAADPAAAGRRLRRDRRRRPVPHPRRRDRRARRPGRGRAGGRRARARPPSARGRPLEAWAFVAARRRCFAVYAAPIVLSGEPTIAGFIKLDDTATWLALTDRIMEHGRDLGGLAPSTYEATLHFNLGDGYPIGAFVPFGVGAELLGDGPRLADPALHRLRRGAARARAVVAGDAARRSPRAARAGRVRRPRSPRCSSATTSGAGSRRWSRPRSSPGSSRSRSGRRRRGPRAAVAGRCSSPRPWSAC